MTGHLNQALHNENFVKECCENFPNSYFDWKVTATFYTALHLVRAFCDNRGVNPGKTHGEIRAALNPKGKPLTQFKPHAWKAYTRLQEYAETARYDTFIDSEVENEIQKDNFEICKSLLAELCKYFATEGVELKKAA